MKKPLLFTFALFLFCQLGFAQDSPNVWYVDSENPDLDNPGGDNDNPGTEDEPWATIQFAIGNSNVNNGDTIKVTPGVYFGSINVTKSIVIQGIGEGTVTISEQIQVSNPNVLLQNLSISSSLIIAGNNASVLNSVINSTLTINSGVTGFTLNENNLANNTATIDNESGEVIDATYNWWGSQEKAAVTSSFDQNVNYSPWLNSGDDIAEDEAGFQPDLSSVSVDGSSEDDLQSAAESTDVNGTINLIENTYNSLSVNKSLSLAISSGQPQINDLEINGSSVEPNTLTVIGNLLINNSLLLDDGNIETEGNGEVALGDGIQETNERRGSLIGNFVTTPRTVNSGASFGSILGLDIQGGGQANELTNLVVRRISGDAGTVEASGSQSIKSRWIINADQDPSGRGLTFSWDASLDNGLSSGVNQSQAVVWRLPDGAEEWEPVTDSQPIVSINNFRSVSVQASEVPGFSTWTVSDENQPLPVTLADFTARLDESSVRLDWATASETNASFFAIERSTDGLFFDEVSRSQAAGESNSLRNYLYIDEGIASRLTGTLYYRLRMVDFDESFEYSNIVSVSLTGDNDLRVYADASAGTLQLFTQQLPAGAYLVQVSDMLGNILVESNLTTTDENPVFSFPLSSPARSVYVVRCFGTRALYTQKFRME